ncbi:MAG: hypothetical protein ABEJ64_04155 [Candidatus Nanohaloarchaea archaeon]
MAIVEAMQQDVQQHQSPASGPLLTELRGIQQTLQQLQVEVSQANTILQDIEQTQQQIVNVSQGTDSRAVEQFETALQQFQQVLNQMNFQNRNEIDFGDIDIDISGGGSVSGDTLIQVIDLVQERDVSIDVLVQKLEMYQQITNQLLVQILQEIRTGDDGGETREFQQVLSVLDQHDLENLSEAERKDLERITEDAKRVIKDEKEGLESLRSIGGRYARMIRTLVKLREGLEKVIEEGEHRTSDDDLRTKSVQGGGWGAIQYAEDDRHGYDTVAAGLSHIHEDAEAIEEHLDEFMAGEKDEEDNLREEITLLREEAERFKEAFQIYRALEAAYEDYDGTRQEFLVSITDQAVSRGIYSDRDMVVNELEKIWEMGPHLERHLRECEGLLKQEYDLGLEEIEQLEEFYGDAEKLEDIWDERYIRELEENLQQVMAQVTGQLDQSDMEYDPKETLVNRAVKAIKVNQDAEQKLGSILQRKKNEEKALQEVEQQLESINF